MNPELSQMEYLEDPNPRGLPRNAFNPYWNETFEGNNGTPLTLEQIRAYSTNAHSPRGLELCFSTQAGYPGVEDDVRKGRDLLIEYYGADRVVMSAFTDDTTGEVFTGVFVSGLPPTADKLTQHSEETIHE